MKNLIFHGKLKFKLTFEFAEFSFIGLSALALVCTIGFSGDTLWIVLTFMLVARIQAGLFLLVILVLKIAQLKFSTKIVFLDCKKVVFRQKVWCSSNKYSKSLSWAQSLNVPPITVHNLLESSAQDIVVLNIFWAAFELSDKKLPLTNFIYR